MGSSDLQLRNKAIPFQAQIHGYNSGAQSAQKVHATSPLGDLYSLAWMGNGNQVKYFPIRFLKPFGGHITQAYLTMVAKLSTAGTNAPGNPPIELFIGAAPFESDGFTLKPLASDPEGIRAKIMADHERIFGTPDAWSGPSGGMFNLIGLDLKKLITYDETSQDYSQYFFGLGLYYVNPPSKGGGYELQKFKLDAAVNLGGL